jgi:hypothetical protein
LFKGEEGKRHESAEFFSDKQSRLVGWQVLEGYPLVAVAALSTASVLKPYASTQRTYIGIISLFSLLLVGACFTGALNQIRNAARKRHAAMVRAKVFIW